MTETSNKSQADRSAEMARKFSGLPYCFVTSASGTEIEVGSKQRKNKYRRFLFTSSTLIGQFREAMNVMFTITINYN